MRQEEQGDKKRRHKEDTGRIQRRENDGIQRIIYRVLKGIKGN